MEVNNNNNNNNIEIPSHFVCPISLQLMRDPVTISTGITYDRDCIEKWFFTFKNHTCPVTKQHLLSLAIIPNHTLRRLIQSWCTLHASDGVECFPTPKQDPSISNLISDANKSSSDEMRCTCLHRIRSFLTTHSQSHLIILPGSSQAFEYAASVLIEVVDPTAAATAEKEVALSILALMDGYDHLDKQKLIKGVIFKNNGDDRDGSRHLLLVHSLLGMLRNDKSRFGLLESTSSVMKVMKLVYSVADSTQMGNVKCETLDEIVTALTLCLTISSSDDDTNTNTNNIKKEATKNGLKLLIELNPWGRNRVKAVGSGAVRMVVELLLQDGLLLNRRITELGLVVLDQLCGCAEGRADLVRHGAGLAVVAKNIMRVSHLATDRAVRVVSSICRHVATPKVVGEMMEVGVVAKLCLIVQLDYYYYYYCGCNKTKERANDLLRLHSRVWKNSPCIPSHLISSFPSST